MVIKWKDERYIEKNKDGYLNEQNAPSEKGKTNLRYILEEGVFDLWTESYGNTNCDMDFSLYPFDTQKCDFILRSVTKNRTYQVYNTIIDQSGAIDHTEKF